MIRGRQSRGEITALVVDEAQALPDEILEEIRLLANMETADRQAAAGRARRPAGARRAVERASPAAAEAAHRAALRAQAARSGGHGGLHRLAHPDGGRRSREHLHPRGGDADSPVLARLAPDDQRDVRQRADVRVCARSTAGRRRDRARSVSRFRSGRRPGPDVLRGFHTSRSSHPTTASPRVGRTSRSCVDSTPARQHRDVIESRASSVLGYAAKLRLKLPRTPSSWRRFAAHQASGAGGSETD